MRRQDGVVVGIVKSAPDELGRVELEFPWLSASYRSRPASIATPMAGGSRGHYFMPEIDDEVLVAFENGVFEHPYIVGFLWNGEHRPPESERENRVIVTPGGHQLRFEDKDGARKVVIESAAGHRISLDDAANTLTVSGAGDENQIVIDVAEGRVTITGATQVKVDAPSVELASPAAHPVVFGDLLLSHLNAMATAFQTHTHPGQLAMGILPVTPMVPAQSMPPATNTLVSAKVKTG